MSPDRIDWIPAFPSLATSQNSSTGEVVVHQSEAGMTLRDYFAAKALAALITEPPWGEGSQAITSRLSDATGDEAMNYANVAYKIADAMLKAREA